MSTPVLARAPSNIAIVKYMGKVPGAQNLPENPSVSLTLDQLCSYVEIAPLDGPEDRFENQAPPSLELMAPELSPAGAAKFLGHVARFRAESRTLSGRSGVAFRSVGGSVSIRSANTFPHSAGIASSASSFAALSLALFAFFAEDRSEFARRWEEDESLREAVAEFSRTGSGSSCRSLMGPWVSWEGSQARRLHCKLPRLVDLVLIAGTEPKAVGSSEAHSRVKTSPHWQGRVERATRRHGRAIQAIEEGDLDSLAQVAFADFRDMHDLFHTSEPPFTYWNDQTKLLREFFDRAGPGRYLLTMDAGPNLHLIVPDTDADRWIARLEGEFRGLRILQDGQGKGAELLRGVDEV